MRRKLEKNGWTCDVFSSGETCEEVPMRDLTPTYVANPKKDLARTKRMTTTMTNEKVMT
jgi:hypothetical protein